MQCERSVPHGNTKNLRSSSTFSRRRRTWSLDVVILQRTVKKCTKIYSARPQLLLCSLNLLFGDVLVAVVVVVCLNSLVTQREERENRHLSKPILKKLSWLNFQFCWMNISTRSTFARWASFYQSNSLNNGSACAKVSLVDHAAQVHNPRLYFFIDGFLALQFLC